MADKKASEESAAADLDGTESWAAVQAGGDVLMTAAQVLAYLAANLPSSVVYTETGTNRDMAATDAGKYGRFTNASAKTAHFQEDSVEPLLDDSEFHIRCFDANLTLTASTGVLLYPPAGGTLELSNGMTVTVKRVAVDVFDVIGQTVPV
jgi:hypothetical protein